MFESTALQATRYRWMLGLSLAIGMATTSAEPGRFEEPQSLTLPTPNAVNAIAIGDIDGDGDGDAFVAYGHIPASGGAAQVPLRDRLLINQGALGYVESTMALDAADPRPSTDALLIDLDRDGDLDAVVAGGGYYDGSAVVASASRVYRNDAGVFGATQTFGVAEFAVGLAAADIDGDGDLDLAVARNTTDVFFPGTVDLYRNDSNAAGLTLNLLQRLPLSTSALAAVRFARNGAGQPPLLMVLRTAESIPGFPPGVLVLRRQSVGGEYGQGQLVPKPASSPLDSVRLRAFDVGDFDLDGRDDLVLAMSQQRQSGIAASRFFRATASGFNGAQPEFVDSGQDFPWASDRAVRMSDIDGDQRADLVFGSEGASECTQTPPGSVDDVERTRFCTGSALNVWISNGRGFQQSGQCFGNRATLFVTSGRIDGDALADLLVARGSGSTVGGAALTASFARLGNDGPTGGATNCCVAEQAAQFGDATLKRRPSHALVKAASPRVDLPAFAQVRQNLMPDSLDGQRLLTRYNQHSDEVVAAMRSDPMLWWRATEVIALWSTPVRGLVDGQGSNHDVDAPMIAAVDDFLNRVSAVASPTLAKIIVQERARLPPLSTFVGMNMTQFSGIALPSDVLLRNGFEVTP